MHTWRKAISIHALLAESDSWRLVMNLLCLYFYPRSPCGERLHLFVSSGVDFAISIHALLAESDAPPYNLMIQHTHFYPRSPCGERRGGHIS